MARFDVTVTQEDVIFEDAVADNICFGRPDTTDAEVRYEAVGAAQLPQDHGTDGGRYASLHAAWVESLA